MITSETNNPTVPSAGSSRGCAITFICQGGDLEIHALLLAASLKQHASVPHELVACVPTPADRWPPPAKRTIEQLKDLGVRIVPVTNELDSSYGIANKISCLEVPHGFSHTVFLDSDVLCLRDFSGSDVLQFDFAAKPADLATYGNDPAIWEATYRAAGLPMPEERIVTTVSQEVTPPYYNSGVLIVAREIPLVPTWLDCARQIRGISNPYFLDQAALPVALRKLGISVHLLEEAYNFPAHLKPVNVSGLPVFCHYHYPSIIRREPLLLDTVHQLVSKTPFLKSQIKNNAKWSVLFDQGKRRRGWRKMLPKLKPSTGISPVRIPELIVSGIPRSGTSYLCKLISRFDNCAVINEPREAVLGLQDVAVPWPLAVFFRETRRRILDGEPVKNKAEDGELQEDTAQGNKRVSYLPNIKTTDFILGIKNTQSFLCRYPGIRQAMPDARWAVCIRNPYDTIASWKSSFSHLEQADVTTIPVGGVYDAFMSPAEHQTLTALASLSNPAERRAALWTFLAEIIIRHREQMILVPYEELVLNPSVIMENVLAGWPKGKLTRRISSSVIRRKNKQLDTEDLQCIGDLCLPAARLLGLETRLIR